MFLTYQYETLVRVLKRLRVLCFRRYLIPYTLGSGMSDGLLRMAESVLESAVSVAKTVRREG